MRRKLKQAHCPERAIEVRLEGEIGEYYLIVEGITVKHQPIYVMAGSDADMAAYYLTENEFYQFRTYYNCFEAKKAYKEAKTRYLGEGV